TATLPLTDAFNPTSFDILGKKIDGLTAVDATNVPIGLIWGFHALTQSSPMTTPEAPQPDLDKVIILLTDGLNTQNRWRSFNMAGDAEVDKRMMAACAAVKAANIKVYTIRVIDGNASLLQGCATKPDMYYNVQSASQLNAVFTTIAQNLANL